jgi:hypothetical protein
LMFKVLSGKYYMINSCAEWLCENILICLLVSEIHCLPIDCCQRKFK